MGLLRIMLAISVFMAHVRNPSWTRGFGGENAVEIFFIISGFYIALILDKSYSKVSLFYKNRILRLYPIYYIVCILVLVRYFIFSNFTESLFNYPPEALTIGTIANTTLLGSDWLMFLQWQDEGLHFGPFSDSQIPLHQMLFIPQAWSLGVEITFYLFAPFFCKLRTRLIVIIFIILFGLRVIGWTNGLNFDPWSYRFFPFELPMFIMGILLYRIRKSAKIRQFLTIKQVYVVLLSAYFAFGYIMSKLTILRFWQLVFLILVSATIILFGSQNKTDNAIGEYSYPFYVSHVLVFSSYWTLLSLLDSRNQLFIYFSKQPIQIVLMLVFTLLVSKMLIRVVAPIEKLRDKNRGISKSLS